MKPIKFDDGFDYIIKDKQSGRHLARFSDQSQVLPYAYKHGRDTVEIEKVERKGHQTMNKGPADQNYFSLDEMKIDQVKEDLLIPRTGNPEKEAKELTNDTGVYHYAVDDDVTGKKAIVRTNVNALNEEEWISKTFYTPDANVIEPNNFDKTDEISVSSIDHVAEAEHDDEEGDSDVKDWHEVYTGLYKHNQLPLAYDDNSGEVVLYDITDASSLENADLVNSFATVEEMNDWIKANLKEEFQEAFSSGNSPQITTGENGVNNNDGNNYGPAPTVGQNDLEFDREGRAEIDEDAESNLITKAREAREDSKNGYVQHIDDLGDGHYRISDWMSDETILSYENGRCVGGEDPLEDDFQQPDHDIPDDIGDIVNNAQFDVEEGKDWRHDPDADEDDWDKQARQRDRQFKKSDKREIDEEVGKHGNNLTGYSDEEAYKYATTSNEEWNTPPLADGEVFFIDNGRVGFMYGDEPVLINGQSSIFKTVPANIDLSAFDGGKYAETAQVANRLIDELSNEMSKKSSIAESVLTEDGIDRVYILAVTFNPDFAEIENKGMIDLEAAAVIASDNLNKDRVVQDIQMGGLPATYVLNRDNQYTLVTLSRNLRDAIEGMISEEICGQLLEEIEISEDVFYGFIIQGGEGDRLDDSTELTEDDEAEYIDPEFVMEAGDIDYDALLNDPDFQNSMKDAYDNAAEAVGQDPAGWDPDLKTVDGIISQGMEKYPHGKKHSFVMTDQNSRDAVNAAFSALWDQGKIK